MSKIISIIIMKKIVNLWNINELFDVIIRGWFYEGGRNKRGSWLDESE